MVKITNRSNETPSQTNRLAAGTVSNDFGYTITVTVVDGSIDDISDMDDYFQYLTQEALAETPPPQKASLPKSYYFATTTYGAKVAIPSENGKGNFTFNVVCNDTAGLAFKPIISSQASNVTNAGIFDVVVSGTYTAQTPSNGAGKYDIDIAFNVTYNIGTAKYTDSYFITGTATQTLFSALLQQILNGNFTSEYEDPNSIQP